MRITLKWLGVAFIFEQQQPPPLSSVYLNVIRLFKPHALLYYIDTPAPTAYPMHIQVLGASKAPSATLNSP